MGAFSEGPRPQRTKRSAFPDTQSCTSCVFVYLCTLEVCSQTAELLFLYVIHRNSCKKYPMHVVGFFCDNLSRPFSRHGVHVALLLLRTGCTSYTCIYLVDHAQPETSVSADAFSLSLKDSFSDWNPFPERRTG